MAIIWVISLIPTKTSHTVESQIEQKRDFSISNAPKFAVFYKQNFFFVKVWPRIKIDRKATRCRDDKISSFEADFVSNFI